MWKSTSSSLTPCKNTAKRVQPEAWPTTCISDGAKAMNKFIKQMEPHQNIDQQISTPLRKILLFVWTWFNFIKCNSMRSGSTKVNECSFKIICHDLRLLQQQMHIHTIYRKNPSTRSTSKSAIPKIHQCDTICCWWQWLCLCGGAWRMWAESDPGASVGSGFRHCKSTMQVNRLWKRLVKKNAFFLFINFFCIRNPSKNLTGACFWYESSCLNSFFVFFTMFDWFYLRVVINVKYIWIIELNWMVLEFIGICGFFNFGEACSGLSKICRHENWHRCVLFHQYVI